MKMGFTVEQKEQNTIICPYANLQARSPIDDEIGLIDICKILWARKLLVLGITFLITVAATGYAFLAPKIYETKVKISPPSALKMRLLDPEITAILPTSATVFANALKNLRDSTVQDQFWTESNIVKRLTTDNGRHLVDMSKTWFMANLSVKESGDPQISVSLSGGDPDATVRVLNDFVSYVDDYSGRVTIDDVKAKLAEKKLDIENLIQSKNNIETKKVQRRIALLTEQKAVAERIEIIGMQENLKLLNNNKKIAEELNLVEIPSDLVGKPLYTRGVRALQAEINMIQRMITDKDFSSNTTKQIEGDIEALRQRKNNYLYIEDLPVLQEQLESIGKINFDNVNISVMEVETALTARHLENPKKQVVVASGLVFGLMMGVSAAFMINFVGKMRSREHEVTQKKINNSDVPGTFQ